MIIQFDPGMVGEIHENHERIQFRWNYQREYGNDEEWTKDGLEEEKHEDDDGFLHEEH